jgi:hypothetical protein
MAEVQRRDAGVISLRRSVREVPEEAREGEIQVLSSRRWWGGVAAEPGDERG